MTSPSSYNPSHTSISPDDLRIIASAMHAFHDAVHNDHTHEKLLYADPNREIEAVRAASVIENAAEQSTTLIVRSAHQSPHFDVTQQLPGALRTATAFFQHVAALNGDIIEQLHATSRQHSKNSESAIPTNLITLAQLAERLASTLTVDAKPQQRSPVNIESGIRHLFHGINQIAPGIVESDPRLVALELNQQLDEKCKLIADRTGAMHWHDLITPNTPEHIRDLYAQVRRMTDQIIRPQDPEEIVARTELKIRLADAVMTELGMEPDVKVHVTGTRSVTPPPLLPS